MFNWFNRVVKDYYKPETYELLVTDTNKIHPVTYNLNNYTLDK